MLLQWSRQHVNVVRYKNFGRVILNELRGYVVAGLVEFDRMGIRYMLERIHVSDGVAE